MSKKPRPPQERPRCNPVAKHAASFNRATVFRDAKAYRRQPKHQGKEPFPIRAA